MILLRTTAQPPLNCLYASTCVCVCFVVTLKHVVESVTNAGTDNGDGSILTAAVLGFYSVVKAVFPCTEVCVCILT